MRIRFAGISGRRLHRRDSGTGGNRSNKHRNR
jgi:hypothetical protein